MQRSFEGTFEKEKLLNLLDKFRQEVLLIEAGNNRDIISTLLELGANPNINPNTQSKDGQTLLHMIACLKAPDVTNKYFPLLLELGANPNIEDKQGRNALRCLMDSEIVTTLNGYMLIKHGANPNTQSKDGETLLHMIACLKAPDVINKYFPLLLELGANPNIKDEHGRNALRCLMDSEIVTTLNGYMLIKHGANPNTQSKDGETLLHMIACLKAPDVINKYFPLLLELGANPNIKDEHGRNALRCLMDSGNISALNGYILIKNGANPNTQSKDGQTLLHMIALKSADDVTEKYIPLLLELGADPNTKNNQKNTALDILIRKDNFSKYKKFCFLLVEYGATSNVTNKKGKNILQIIYEEYPDIEQKALSCGIPKKKLNNTQYVFNNFPLLMLEMKYHSSVYQNRNNILNFLILLVCNKNKDSIFYNLPIEIIGYILSFTTMDTFSESVIALTKEAFSQKYVIKDMLQSPGGICAIQKKYNDTGYVFKFFKSSEILCMDFISLKEKLNNSESAKPSFFEKKIGNGISNSVNIKLNEFRQKYALEYWKNHSSLFKNPVLKLKLLKNIENSELYNNKKTKPGLKI